MADINDVTAKASKLPAGVQFAIITALPNCVNGAFWGFCDYDEVKQYGEVIKADKNIIARKLGNACLIEVNPDYLYRACNAIDPELMTQEDVNTMKKYMGEAVASFEKFLMTKGEKETKPMQICVYSLNDSNAVTYQGVSYPAFRLNLSTTLQLLAKWGYGIVVDGKFVSCQVAMQNVGKVFNAMKLSPTNTGVFLTVKCGVSPEKIKELKAQYGYTKKKQAPSK